MWSLLRSAIVGVLLAPCGSAHVSLWAQPEKTAAVTLTDGNPQGTFPLAAATLATAPPLLRISVTRVVNPHNTAFQIFVSLAAYTADAKGAQIPEEKIPLGNVGLYPANRPGAFMLPASGAFAELKRRRWMAKGERVLLLVEIKKLHADRPWTRVEATIAPPRWLAETGNED